MKFLVSVTAFLIGVYNSATALSPNDTQYLVDNVQSLAFNYAQTQKQGGDALQNPQVASAVQTLFPEKQQGPQCLSGVQSISRLAYQMPITELMNTADIKQLMGAPDMVLGENLRSLKAIVAQYQAGQPVKAQVLGGTQKGTEIYTQVRYFPEIVEKVRAYDPSKVTNLQKKTDIIYVFNEKTSKLTKIISEAYSQALDLNQPPQQTAMLIMK